MSENNPKDVAFSHLNHEKPRDLFALTNGIDVDCRLAEAEIKVQKAWLNQLEKASFMSAEQTRHLLVSLDKACQLIRDHQFPWRIEDEDIHMNLERFLVEHCGEYAKKIHLGRSRNDLIATTLRIFVSDCLTTLQTQILDLLAVLLQQAENHIDFILPGMTHMQNGQPLRLSQVFLSYSWQLRRDVEATDFVRQRAKSTLPLGAAAMAGSTLDIDYSNLAQELGFASPCHNSYDAVGDRDPLVEGLSAMSLFAIHLSRLSEDFIYFSSSNVALAELPDRWSTGSSIMPNKRNPDVFELTRAKSAKIIGHNMQAQCLTKGLASSYHSDLHELKSCFISAYDELIALVKPMTGMLKDIRFNQRRAHQALNQGHVLATDIANYLVETAGLSFRDAYQMVKKWIYLADQQNLQIHDYVRTVKSDDPLMKAVQKETWTMEGAIERRRFSGGVSRSQIQIALEKLQSWLARAKKKISCSTSEPSK